MANILEKYGIKEVADVVFLELASDGTETPVLCLDTLKVSTIEETAEQVEAKGGKGNAPLIIWDYGKEINLNIEDALYSPKSMALMHSANPSHLTTTTSATITKYKNVIGGGASISNVTVEQGNTKTTTVPVTKIYDASGATVELTTALTKGDTYIVAYEVTATNASTIEISASAFPGTYKVIGDTYARSQKTGKDQFFQFVIPQAKMGVENTITLEAEGDPSVFSMTLRVLRPDDGKMMMLTQYDI